MRKAILILILCTTAMLCIVASCGRKKAVEAGEKRISVITSLFPLYDFARNIGGNKVDVMLLLPPGVEAHTFEPRPADIVRIDSADIFVYTGEFMEPWVKDILASVTNKNLIVVNSSEGVSLIEGADEHEGGYGVDPHIWLDFANAQKMVDNICKAMITRDPNNKGLYITNADDYKLKLEKLDKEYRSALSDCKHRTIINTGHFAFGYLAKRYNLTLVSAYKGFTPDSEPTPRDMAGLIDTIKKSGIKYLYYEEMLSPKVAQVLEKETGAELLSLNGAHNVSKEAMNRGDTFISIMERNLENLKKGLQCQ
jgi:zinc transport system substrate-binding protein